MFSSRVFFTVLVITSILISCGPGANAPQRKIIGGSWVNFLESKDAWEEVKQEEGNSYKYTVQETFWTGNGYRTTIEIKNGKVISREFEAYTRDENTGVETITESYTESEQDLRSHEKGAAPLTMDQLYDNCTADYLTADTTANEVYFDTDEAGILNLCGYVPQKCADDCFQGISISDFSFL